VAFAAILALATIALALFRLYNSACSYDRHLDLFDAAKKIRPGVFSNRNEKEDRHFKRLLHGTLHATTTSRNVRWRRYLIWND